MNKPKQKALKALLLITAAILVGIVFYYYSPRQLPYVEYRETYRLVAEKISQSATITVNLPPEVDKNFAKKNIVFEPEITGKWLEERPAFSLIPKAYASNSDFNVIYFIPEEKLKIDHYYNVILTTQDKKTIRSDFVAVEDPEVLAIFPRAGSETSEFSEITIAFSRPMVPLSSLSEMKDQKVPVEISPKTEGTWKWITTRNLQFVPEQRLQRSSAYTVSIKPGFTSMDGLALQEKTVQFNTRLLRLNHITTGTVNYNQPIRISFNQPVDLEKTLPHIELRRAGTREKIPFIAEYPGGKGTIKSSTEQNLLSKILPSFSTASLIDNTKETASASVIHVYNAKDSFGREKIWDFEERYELVVKKAYPAEGDIPLSQPRSCQITVLPFIKQVVAYSDRTNQSRPEFFDPKGKIIVYFEEEIDLEKSSITAPHLDKIEYGRNKKEIHIFFHKEKVGKRETIPISFIGVVNTEGIKVISKTITKTIISFPQLELLRSYPADFQNNASLKQLTLCTNTPLLAISRDGWKDHISANKELEMNYWGFSRYISRIGSTCRAGEFQTEISYGLMPLEKYEINLLLKDVFGQEHKKTLSFTTSEMPSSEIHLFSYQNTSSVAPPERTTFLYGTRNIDFVNLNVCKLPAQRILPHMHQRLSHTASFETIAGCLETVNVNIPLPKRYWVQNQFTVDISNYFADPLGHYIITLSHPNYKSNVYDSATRSYKDVNRYHHSYLSVTNLGVAEKKINPASGLIAQHEKGLENLYWVNDIKTLSPVAGATVSLYQGEGFSFAGQFSTNEQGIAKAPVISDLLGVVVRHENDTTVLLSRDSRLNYAQSITSAENIYLYTDKPIYQPSQQVFIKGIHRIGYDGSYEIMEEKEVGLTVRDPRYNEIFSEKVYLSEMGTFDTSFLLSNDAHLGMYRICAQEHQCIYVDVQEYVASPFEVKISSEKEDYVSQEEVTIEVSAQYYFGVPLESGRVSYTLSSQNYFFDKYRDRYFNFGFYGYFERPFYYGDRFVFEGRSELKDGKAEIKYKADLEDFESTGGRIIIADVTVQNPEGESVSGQFSFVVHPGEKYLGVATDRNFLAKGEPTLLRVKSVDTGGKEASARNVTVKISKIEWQYHERQEATGGFSRQWERKENEIQTIQFNTDSNGNYQQEIRFDSEGEYLIEASMKDGHENLIKSSGRVYVYGEGRTNIYFPQGTALELEALNKNLRVGDIGEIVIKSPYDKAVALIAVERGKIFEYQIKEIKGSISRFSFQVKEEYAPNVFVSVLLQSQGPEVRFASERFSVDSEQYGLNVEIKPSKSFYLPGEKAEVDIKITDYKDRPVQAEFSLSVVDLSILALKGNPKKAPLTFFYSGFPLTVATSSNIKNILPEVKTSITKGGGGGSPDLETKVRGDFKELAVWEAVVKTNQEGKARVSFRLPDNITRWQAEAVGITEDTKIGAGYAEFTARKELMVTPLRPRFLVPGDQMLIGARVFNETEESQIIDVSFESDTMKVIGTALRTAKLGAQKSQTFYFEVKAPGNITDGFHEFVLSAKSPTQQDIVVQSIPITPSNVYETVATAYSTPHSIVQEYVFLPEGVLADRGELSVSYSATLAVFMSDALDYLLRFPYGCAEQISSQLNALAILKKGLDIPNVENFFQLSPIIYQDREISLEEFVEIGTAKLYSYQQRDGGFAMWPGGSSSFYATLYVVEALQNLKEAGYKINESSLNEGAGYLFNQATKNRNIYANNNNVIMAAYQLLSLPEYQDNETLILAVKRIIRDQGLVENLSNTTLAQIAVIAARSFDQETKNFIFNTLDNRLKIDARGAFLSSNQNFLWYSFETNAKNTALYLKAIAISGKEHPFSDQIVRWLISSRARDGGWGNTNNTLVAIDAFTEYLSWKKETESSFTLKISVNDSEKDKFTFQPENIFEQKKTVVPIKDLSFNALNKITFTKENHNQLENRFFYDMVLRYHLPLEQAPPQDEGFSVTRAYYRLDDKTNQEPVKTARVGEVLRVNLQVTAPITRRHAVLEDFIPAGFEIVNLNLATEQKSLRLQDAELRGRELRPTYQELKNDRAFLYTENLPAGVYEFDYFVRALIPGKFAHLPASAFEMYFPENFGRTTPSYFEILAQ